MDELELKTALAEILEKRGIVSILDTLAEVCEKKAEYAKRHEAMGVGARWQRRAGQLQRIAATMEEEKLRYG